MKNCHISQPLSTERIDSSKCLKHIVMHFVLFSVKLVWKFVA